MKLPSPSKHELASICAGAFALPHSDFVGERWSTRGTAVHAFLSDVPTLGAEKALERVPEEWFHDCEIIDLTKLPVQRDMYAAEVTFAYNVDTGDVREVGRKLTREEVYKRLRPGEMPGTPDVVGLTADAVVILDYKTGHYRYGPATGVRQTRSYAYWAAKAYKKERAIVGILRITEDGESYLDFGELTEFDLATIELELQEMVAAVRTEQGKVARGELPKTVEGDHCDRCPALPYCPAKMALVRQFAATPDVLDITIAEATEEQLAAAYARANAAEKVIERVKRGIAARARQAPIALGGGLVLGKVKEEEVILEKAVPVLEEMYGPLVADAATEKQPTISKASIKRALEAHVVTKERKITHLMRDVMTALRNAKAIFEGEKLSKHKPKELPAGQEAA